MAVLCRCKKHSPQNNKRHIYTHYAYPTGYPNTSSICGSDCRKMGFIYMTEREVVRFNEGERIFEYPSNATKVKVEDRKPVKRKIIL